MTPTAFDVDWCLNPIDDLVTLYGGMFLTTGWEITMSLAVIIFVISAAKHGFTGGFVLFFLNYGFTLVLALTLLKYYYQPLTPFGLSVSVHQILPAMAEAFANKIDLARMDTMFSYVANVLTNLEHAGVADWAMIPISLAVQLFLWIIQAACLGPIVISYLALGMFNLVGPLFIPWIMSPRLSFLFWNWTQACLQYSFYRVLASALSFVGATATVTFLDKTVHGDYSLAHFAVIMPKMLLLVVLLLWAATYLGTFVSDLFKGTSSGGTTISAAAASALKS